MNIQNNEICSSGNNNPELFATPDRNSFCKELKEAILARNILTARTRQKILSSLDDINQTKEELRRRELREKAINEILTSEKAYIHQLGTILKYFIIPIRNKKLISFDHFNTIFGNIETIYNVNKELLCELEKNSENVATAFLKLAPFFKLYSVYAYEYRRSLTLLQENEAKNREFSKFLENQENRPEVSQKLSALLITPIQRVPRYRLLLKEVLAYTTASDPDSELLKKSLNEVEQAAFHINSLVEEQENTQRILELQRCLYNQKPNIIKPGRKLIKEGFVSKMAQNGAHGCQRYLIVLSDIILYCKLLRHKPTDPNSLQCRCILPLHKCRVTEIASKGIFTITCQNENLIMYCEPAIAVEEWISVLQDAIKKYVDCRKTLRKPSSSRKPARQRQILNYDENTTIATKQQIQQRKRTYHQIKKPFENVTNLDSLEENLEVKRFKSNCIPDTIQETQENESTNNSKKIVDTIGLYGLKKQVSPNEENVYSRIRTYFWGVGKSIKNIFGR